MVNSQNGWTASSDRRAIGVTPFIVHGVSFPGGVKAGDVATVLGYLADRFHRAVEPLVAGECWGHRFRAVTGGRAVSNHGSGTAIDINAPSHGYGDRGTFTGSQVVTIRRILNELGGVIRWGGDYTGTADEMHFEINKGPAEVAAVAARIRAGEDDDMTLNKAQNDAVAQTWQVTGAPKDDKAAEDVWNQSILGEKFGFVVQQIWDIGRALAKLQADVDELKEGGA